MLYPRYCSEKFQGLFIDLIESIPIKWKHIIDRSISNNVNVFVPSVTLSDRRLSPDLYTSKTLYDIFICRKFKPPISLPFIESFGIPINESFWNSIFHHFKNPDMLNIDLKIAYGIIWTKEKLYRIKKTDNNLCPICGTDIEEILHMFVECDFLQSFHIFLKDVLSFFYQSSGFTRDEFNRLILFGKVTNGKYYAFINILLSLSRIAIYKRRCYMSLNGKLLNCIKIFEFYFKQHLQSLYTYYKLNRKDKFYKHFENGIPYVKIVNDSYCKMVLDLHNSMYLYNIYPLKIFQKHCTIEIRYLTIVSLCIALLSFYYNI